MGTARGATPFQEVGSGIDWRRWGNAVSVDSIWRSWTVFAAALAVAVPARADCAGAELGLQAVQQELSRGQVDDALSRLSDLEDRHPACGPVATLQAQVQAGLGRMNEAERSFQRAAELAPQRPEPHFQLGVFYDSRQQHGKAAEQFRKVLAITPSDPQAYDYLGLSLEALGEFDKAQVAYRMGLSRNKGPRFDPMLHYNYGRFLMKHGRIEDAKGHLDEAARHAPGVRAVQYERARVALRLGDTTGARTHAEEALGLEDPGGVILDMQVHYLLSRVYRALGEDELAAKFSALSRDAEIPLAARRRSGGR